MSTYQQALVIATVVMLVGALIAAVLKLMKNITENRLLEFCDNNEDWSLMEDDDAEKVLNLLNVFDLSKFNFFNRPAAVLAIERNDDIAELRCAGIYAHSHIGGDGEETHNEHTFYLFRDDQVNLKTPFHFGKSLILRYLFRWQPSIKLSVESKEQLKFRKWHVEGRGPWLLLYRPYYSSTITVFQEDLSLSFEACKLVRKDLAV